MDCKAIKILALSAIALSAFCTLNAEAQEPPKSPEQQEKEFYEQIEKTIEQLTISLNLEEWQQFYADSILVHNLHERGLAIEEMRRSKVSNTDLYYKIADKWDEATYQAFRKILDDEQWDRYNRKFAGRAKKDRDRRAQKGL